MIAALTCICVLSILHVYLFWRQKQVHPNLRLEPLYAFCFDLAWCGLLLLPSFYQSIEMMFGVILGYVIIKPFLLKLLQKNVSSNFTEIWPHLIPTVFIVSSGYSVVWFFEIEDSLTLFLLFWTGWSVFETYVSFVKSTHQMNATEALKTLNKPELEDGINQILNKAGLPRLSMKVKTEGGKVPHANARIVENGKDKQIIFEKDLINILDEAEIKAVIAHEVGHLLFRHLLKFHILKACLYLLGVFILYYGQFSVFEMLLLAPILSCFFLPFLNGFKRRCEFQADQFAHETAGGGNLISALDKIHTFNKSVEKSDALFQWFFGGHPDPVLRKKRLKDETNGTGKMHLA